MSAPDDSKPQTQQPYVVQESRPPVQDQYPAQAQYPGPAQAQYPGPAQQTQYPQPIQAPAQYAVQPYGQQGYGQQPYPQPSYVQPMYIAPYPYTPSPPRGLSISSMVIGLVSLFFGFTFVLPVVGFILGIMGARKEPAGRAMAVTGIVLNGLFLLAWVALVLLWVFLIGGLFATVGGAATTGIPA